MDGRSILVDNNGETQLEPGDVTTHVAGEPNGHHLINRTDGDVLYLVVGTRNPKADTVHYPDVDLHLPANGTENRQYENNKGDPYLK